MNNWLYFVELVLYLLLNFFRLLVEHFIKVLQLLFHANSSILQFFAKSPSDFRKSERLNQTNNYLLLNSNNVWIFLVSREEWAVTSYIWVLIALFISFHGYYVKYREQNCSPRLNFVLFLPFQRKSCQN